MTLFPALQHRIAEIQQVSIAEDRLAVLKPMIQYIQQKQSSGNEVNLNFICTHNSRRSQFSQIWAQTAAIFFGIPAHCFSGGVEITAFNERAVACLLRSGFQIRSIGTENPKYSVCISDDLEPLIMFSKRFDDPINQAGQFAAIMTCSHADEHCPFIPGSEMRIPVRYEDPKDFDNTPTEAAKYDERSAQIAREMFYVFSQIKK